MPRYTVTGWVSFPVVVELYAESQEEAAEKAADTPFGEFDDNGPSEFECGFVDELEEGEANA